MSTFVLVQGAWHGSWCWNRVRKRLQASGHDVFTPTLTGLAERSHLLRPEVDLETHIQDVLNVIRWEELSDIVLCGHSYGGAVVTGVADRVPERIRALVYLDAFVLGDNESVFQHMPSETAARMLERVNGIGEGWKAPPVPAEVFQVNEADRDWVDAQCTFQSLATFQQRLRLTGGIKQIPNIVYIRATGYAHGAPFQPFYEKARAAGWKTLEMPCGHDVMLDMPDELTAALVDAA